MTQYDAVMIAEGVQKAGPRKSKQAWQYLVDTGLVWKLQGFFGRTAADMLRAGYLKPQKRCRRCGSLKILNKCPNSECKSLFKFSKGMPY